MYHPHLKYTSFDQNRKNNILPTLCLRNYKHFGSFFLDHTSSNNFKTKNLKTSHRLDLSLTRFNNYSGLLAKSDTLRKCTKLSVTNHKKTFIDKKDFHYFLKQAKKVKTVSAGIDAGFELLQSCPITFPNQMIKYFRLHHSHLHLYDYGNNLDLHIKGDTRKILFKSTIRGLARQNHLRTLSLQFNDYSTETSYSEELSQINSILKGFPYLSYFNIGQSLGSYNWDTESSRKLIVSLSQCKGIKRLSVAFDEEKCDLYVDLIKMLQGLPLLKRLDLNVQVSKKLMKCFKAIKHAASNLTSLSLTINNKNDSESFWKTSGRWLKSLISLTELTINYKGRSLINESKLKPFIESISNLKTLHKLKINGSFGKQPYGFLVLVLNAVSTLETLSRIKIHGHCYDSTCNDHSLKPMLEAIKVISSKLYNLSLVFGSGKVTEESLADLQQAIVSAKKLESLELTIRSNGLNSNGLKILNETIMGSRILKHVSLDLTGRHFSKDSLICLVKGLLGTIKTGNVELIVSSSPAVARENVKEVRSLIRSDKKGKEWVVYFPHIWKPRLLEPNIRSICLLFQAIFQLIIFVMVARRDYVKSMFPH